MEFDDGQDGQVFDAAADRAVELGNRLLEEFPEADAWEVASGLLAGAIHFWLYTRQPCGDPGCESCATVSDADLRLKQLFDEVRQSAEESSYYHSPTDRNAGTA
jgi:hypothetical protein